MANRRKPAKLLNRLQKTLPDNVDSIESIDDNSSKWLVRILGPEKSLYANGRFDVFFEFPKAYPFQPPSVKFNTCIYHINITSVGHVCMAINEEWDPKKHKIDDMFTSLIDILTEPLPDSPINLNAGAIFFREDTLYDDTAKLWTKLFASIKDNKEPISFKDARIIVKNVQNKIQNGENNNENKDDNKDDNNDNNNNNNNNNKNEEFKNLIEKLDIDEHKELDPIFIVTKELNEALMKANDDSK